jgi:HD-like signal output (HDOD) protein
MLRSEVNVSAIEQVIVKDAGLASEILRKANTAYFAGRRPAEDLRSALVRLGSQAVLSVVMMASQEQAFRAKDMRLNGAMNRLWLHSMVSAVTARRIMEVAGARKEAEIAFLCGLLHDLGSLVIIKVIDEMMSAGRISEITDADLDELISLLHTDFGHKVIASWGLPQVFAEVARDHDLVPREGNCMLDAVRVADAVLTVKGVGQAPDPDLPVGEMPEVRRLGLDEEQVTELLAFVEEAQEQALSAAVGRR